MQKWQIPAYSRYEYAEKNNDYCVCVFVINEGEKFLQQLERMQSVCKGIVDIVVADGGSTDGSTEEKTLKGLGVNTLLVKEDSGKLGSQMRMAFAWALKRGYKGIVCVDGNGKDGIDAIPDFVKELQSGVDHVQGSRFIPGGHHENTPKSRLLGLKLLHTPMIRLASGFHYTDTTNGFRAYSAKLLADEKISIFRNCFTGYELHYYLAVEASKQGFACSEIPVTRIYPRNSTIPTKISGVKGNVNVIFKLFLASLHIYAPWKQLFKYLRTYLAILVSVIFAVIAFFSLYHNSFAVIDSKAFDTWEIDSEKIVINSKINPQTRHEHKWYSLHPMLSHYPGGQGIASSYLMHLCENQPLAKKIEYLHVIEVMLSILILAYLCYWLGTELSLLSSIAFAVCAILSPSIVISARNIYWSMWTMYLPLALGLFCLRKCEQCKTSKHTLLIPYLIVVAITMFIKNIFYFEFSSSMMILAELPLLYYAIKNSWSSKKYFLNALATGIVALVVFCFSWVLYFLQLYYYCTNSDFSKAWLMATISICKRIGLDANRIDDIFLISFLPGLNQLFDIYLSKFYAIFDYKIGDYILYFRRLFIIVAVVLLLSRYKNKEKIRTFFAVSVLAFLSMSMQFIWIITAKGHSQIHQHINFILWNIPLLLMSGAIGFYISMFFRCCIKPCTSFLKKAMQLIKAYIIKQRVCSFNKVTCGFNKYSLYLILSIFAGIVVLLFVSYKSNYSGYDLLLKKFKTQGKTIPHSDVQYVAFPDQRKIIFRIPKNIRHKTFFVHVCPTHKIDLMTGREKYGFNQYDFKPKNEQIIPKPFLSRDPYTMVKVNLPYYQFLSCAIGQFDNKQSYWVLTQKKEIPKTRCYYTAKLNDANWKNGVARWDERVLCFPQNDIWILDNDLVKLPDDSTATVVRVYSLGSFFHVILNKKIDPEIQKCLNSKPIIFTKSR